MAPAVSVPASSETLSRAAWHMTKLPHSLALRHLPPPYPFPWCRLLLFSVPTIRCGKEICFVLVKILFVYSLVVVLASPLVVDGGRWQSLCLDVALLLGHSGDLGWGQQGLLRRGGGAKFFLQTIWMKKQGYRNPSYNLSEP